MLSRYSDPTMMVLWSDQARYERWREVELAVLDAQAGRGEYSVEVAAAARETPAPTPEDVELEERRVGHDVVAFLNIWTSAMSPLVASHVHRAMTSSDVVDTAQAMAMRDATLLVDHAVRDLVVVLCERALELRDVRCVGRTHGQPAALSVVGHRFADFAQAAGRVRRRLGKSAETISVVKLSGPVGAGVGLEPDLVAAVAERLGLGIPPVTTQVVFRDGVAAWMCDLALLGAVCEAVATDVRLGQHDGVRELVEGRSDHHVGSSAMPHKRNPVAAESITGLARVLRGYVGPSLEDVALWQHRDISQSSVERVIVPDAAALARAITDRTVRLVRGIRVDREQVEANIARAGATLASADRQTALMADGISRADAADQIRAELADGRTGGFDLQQTSESVLGSAELDRVFAEVEHLLGATRLGHARG